MDITGNPWIVLAADVAGGPLTIWKGVAHIVQIVFSKYNGGGDSVTINRLNGTVFAVLTGKADLDPVNVTNLQFTPDGLVIPIGGITSGQVFIYHR